MMSTIKFFPLLSLLIVSAGILVEFANLGQSYEFSKDAAEVKQSSKSVDASELPPVFNFEHFKQTFGRKYKSFLEELARRKLYLARAFKVFISKISYKHNKSSSYLAINQFSDWAPSEFKKLSWRADEFINKGDPENGQTFVGNEEVDETPEIPAADVSDIKEELNKIEKSDEPGISEIKEEINEFKNAKKLSVDDNFNDTDIDLIEINLANPKLSPSTSTESLDSNQEETILSSKKPMSETLANEIGDSSGSTYLASILTKYSSSFIEPSKSEAVVFRGVSDKKIIHGKNGNKGSNLPDKVDIDHREGNCLLKVRSQGECGSCYIFATMALYEWHYCMQTGNSVAFSEQYILDCSPRGAPDLKGCHGGWPTDITGFVKRLGLELRSDYPYRARVNKCAYDAYTPAKSMGYVRVKDATFEEVPLDEIEKRLKKAPLLINMATSDDLYDYGGGVDKAEGCSEDELHSIPLVGSGRENGLDYWLLRNSFSKDWGEKGYYKLYKHSGCIYENMAFDLRVDFSEDANPHHDASVLEEKKKKKAHNSSPVEPRHSERLRQKD